MPRLWSDTIDAHRREVRDAILDATVALVHEHGLAGVSMSQIAGEAGIGRATLYKYFDDVEAIMHAWHERQVSIHLQELVQARDAANDPEEQLRAVLEHYGHIAHEKHDVELAALLHRGEHFARAQKQLLTLIAEIVAAGRERRVFRADVPPNELASYCLHAVTAAGAMTSKAAVRRLVNVTISALTRNG